MLCTAHLLSLEYRSRADNHVPQDRHAEYYAQRASAGLIITEATYIAAEGALSPVQHSVALLIMLMC